jgi:hypothetical protein
MCDRNLNKNIKTIELLLLWKIQVAFLYKRSEA